MIIARYITKEVSQATLTVTLILLAIALSNRFVIYLAKVATGSVPLNLMLKIMGLTIPGLLSQLLPLAFFIGLIFCYGRLYVDNEMSALQAAGLGPRFLQNLTLKQSIPYTLICALLALWWVPSSARLREQVIRESEATGILQAIKPGRFQTLSDGRVIFYVEAAGPLQSMHHIFIAEQPKTPQLKAHDWTVIMADSAKLEARHPRHYHLSLSSGQRVVGTPGTRDMTVIDFSQYGRAIRPQIEPLPNLLKLKSTAQLIKGGAPDQAEWQWRLSTPFTVPILALIALRLCPVAPRQGRFARFLPSILCYILYLNVLLLARRWGGLGLGPPWLGLVLCHASFIAFALSQPSRGVWRLKGRT